MKRYLLLAGVGFCCVSGAALAAIDCATPPSCDELGYAYEEIDCDGQTTLKCPFDDAKVYCPNPESPAEKCLADGYYSTPCLSGVDKTCPYDEAYHTCKVTTCSDMHGFTDLLNCDCSIGYVEVPLVENCYRCATEMDCPIENGIRQCRACPKNSNWQLVDDDETEGGDDETEGGDGDEGDGTVTENPGGGSSCPPGGCDSPGDYTGEQPLGGGEPTSVFGQP